MGKGILKEGGPLGVRRTGRDSYELDVTIPTDADGRRARECPRSSCSPGDFKVVPGTGIQEQESAYCPEQEFTGSLHSSYVKRWLPPRQSRWDSLVGLACGVWLQQEDEVHTMAM